MRDTRCSVVLKLKFSLIEPLLEIRQRCLFPFEFRIRSNLKSPQVAFITGPHFHASFHLAGLGLDSGTLIVIRDQREFLFRCFEAVCGIR